MCGALWKVEHLLAIDGLAKYIQTNANVLETQSLVEKHMFEIKNITEDKGQSSPKSIGTLTVLWCIFGPNLEILISIRGDLSHKLKMGSILTLKLNLTLKVKVIHPPKTIGIYTYGPNFVILALIVAELSCGQARDWWKHGRTHRKTDGHTHTHAGNDNTRRPQLASGKNPHTLDLLRELQSKRS